MEVIHQVSGENIRTAFTHNEYTECPLENLFNLPFGFPSLSGKVRLLEERPPDL